MIYSGVYSYHHAPVGGEDDLIRKGRYESRLAVLRFPMVVTRRVHCQIFARQVLVCIFT